MNKLLIVLMIVLMFFSGVPHLMGEHTQTETIILNCTQTNGLINHFSEINCGPLPNSDFNVKVDLTKQFKEIGMEYIRTHDFSGPTDINMIFPDFSDDPLLPSSYNFTSSDEQIKGIIDAGCKVFYRLGESASMEPAHRQPPVDFDKWADICKHVIMHYNDGWADGFFYDIEYFEIWNEPDLKGFWNGTAEQYYALYHTTVETLKSYDPSLKIGGPCTSSIYNEDFTTRFLTYVIEHDLPLDFFSWHMYANHPHDLYNGSLYVRSLLDSYGFSAALNINTEWNINIGFPQRDKDNAKNAAFTASSLIVFQDADIDYSYRYRANADDNWLMRCIGFDLSLFSPYGEFKTPALIYKIMNLMEKETPLRLQSPMMDALSGCTYLAGISEDGSNLSILISTYEAGDNKYQINIDDVPWASNYSLYQYVIDDNTDFTIRQIIVSDASTCEFNDTIKESTVHFIRITNMTRIPEEGPDTYDIPHLLKLKILDVPRLLIAMMIMNVFFNI